MVPWIWKTQNQTLGLPDSTDLCSWMVFKKFSCSGALIGASFPKSLTVSIATLRMLLDSCKLVVPTMSGAGFFSDSASSSLDRTEGHAYSRVEEPAVAWTLWCMSHSLTQNLDLLEVLVSALVPREPRHTSVWYQIFSYPEL